MAYSITLDQLELVLIYLKNYIENNAGTTIGWDNVSNKPETFTPSDHTHDDRYYTESEVDSLLAGKSDTGHTHSQYLTSHAPVDSKLSSTSTNAVQNKVVQEALAGKAASDHTHSQYLTEHQDISGKANTSGTYPSLISGGARDYNDGTTITFGYSTAGMSSTSYLASWDGYKLRAIAPKNVSAGYASTAGTANAAYYADYAEFFPRGEETEVGDIIALDEFSENEQYIKATENSICIIGVHSEDYGIIVGGENPKDNIISRDNYFKYNISKYIPVGLAGRVPVKFKGVSHKGLRVVPSEIPGVGRAFDATKDDRDSIIGYLVESDNRDNDEIRLLKMKIK